MTEELAMVDKLIEEIHTGTYKPNDKLPSENVLADMYKVPRITARKAYNRLQELGYIFSRQGMGSYVKDRRQQIPLVLSGNVSFSQKMIEQGYDYKSKNICCEPIDYCEKIFQALDAAAHERVFKIGRLRIVDRQAIALHISYVPESVFADIATEGSEITSMWAYYQTKGYHEIHSKQSILSVNVPTRYERELLDCTGMIPLLSVESVCTDKDSGTVLEYTKILYRSDCFTYVITN